MSGDDREPNVRQAVPFLLVADVPTSVAFYRDGLGFRVVDEWIDDGVAKWCWLELGHAALMLQKSRGPTVSAPREAEDRIVVFFICRDALAIYREAGARGLEPSEPFVSNAMWVTALRDPDGHGIEFESDTDVREGTCLSEVER